LCTVIRFTLVALFMVAACSASVPSTPAPVDLKDDDSGLVDLPASRLPRQLDGRL
jgi:hypothetical protein